MTLVHLIGRVQIVGRCEVVLRGERMEEVKA